jgi:predicted ATPase
LYHRNPESWQKLKRSIEDFGRASGLFDEISIKLLGRSEGTPFQVQVRKFSGKGRKGPPRNLIDVGYGVSQSLPLLSELLRNDASQIFLLQQPEVHLHPVAQAALGTLFCQLAGRRQQLIVETHSDHLIDRVRMDIRDKTTSLTHKDVSILYFEPNDLDVTIHSLRIDDRATIIDPPDSYRRFFMDELRRSVGL